MTETEVAFAPTKLDTRRRRVPPVVVGLAILALLVLAVAKPWGGGDPGASLDPSAAAVAAASQSGQPASSPDSSAEAEPTLVLAPGGIQGPPRLGAWGISVGTDILGSSTFEWANWSQWVPLEPVSERPEPPIRDPQPIGTDCASVPTVPAAPTVLGITVPEGTSTDFSVLGWFTNGPWAATVDEQLSRIDIPGRSEFAALARRDGLRFPDGRYELHLLTPDHVTALGFCIASGAPGSGAGGLDQEMTDRIVQDLAPYSGAWGVGTGGNGPRLVRDEPWTDWVAVDPRGLLGRGQPDVVAGHGAVHVRPASAGRPVPGGDHRPGCARAGLARRGVVDGRLGHRLARSRRQADLAARQSRDRLPGARGRDEMAGRPLRVRRPGRGSPRVADRLHRRPLRSVPAVQVVATRRRLSSGHMARLLSRKVPLAELHCHLGGAVTPAIMWGIAHAQGIRLPTKDYWEFRDMITVSSKRAQLRRLPPALPLDRAHPVVPDRGRAGGLRGRRRRVPQEQRHDDGAPLQPDEAEPRRRAGPRPHHRRGRARDGPGDPRVPGQAGPDLLPRPGVPVRAQRDPRARRRSPGATGASSASTSPAPRSATFRIADYRRLYRRARQYGLGLTVHTGEAGPVDEVARVVELLEPDRIGHGVKAAYDPRAMAMIRERGIVLEICPTSNINTQVVSGWDEFRWIFDQFRRNEVRFTINTDGPEMLKTYIRDELATLGPARDPLARGPGAGGRDLARGLVRAQCLGRPAARPRARAAATSWSARRPDTRRAAQAAGVSRRSVVGGLADPVRAAAIAGHDVRLADDVRAQHLGEHLELRRARAGWLRRDPEDRAVVLARGGPTPSSCDGRAAR